MDVWHGGLAWTSGMEVWQWEQWCMKYVYSDMSECKEVCSWGLS